MSIHAYKDSEVGKIPSEWSVKQIGKIGYTYSGLTGKGKNDFGKGNARYITFLNVLNNPVLRTNIFERVSVSDGEHQNLALKGDLFFNTSSETPEEVGICALLDDDVPNLYLNSFCFGYRLTDPEVDGLFLSYFFRSKAGRDIMTMLAQGATRYNLSKESFNKTLIAFPPFEEQKKIAEALSGIDDMLGALDEAIAKKRLIKEGLMQQLLTGKTRLPGFSDEWEELELASILSYEQPGPFLVHSTDYVDSGVPVLTAGKTFILGYTNEDFGIYNNLPVIIFDDFVTDSKYVDFPFKAKSSAMKMLSVRDKDRHNIRFIYDVMQLIDFPMTDHKRWWIAEYSHLKVRVPTSIAEENAIANAFSTIDKEIHSFEAQREKYTLIKQGMMQELLTGKTRLI